MKMLSNVGGECSKHGGSLRRVCVRPLDGESVPAAGRDGSPVIDPDAARASPGPGRPSGRYYCALRAKGTRDWWDFWTGAVRATGRTEESLAEKRVREVERSQDY